MAGVGSDLSGEVESAAENAGGGDSGELASEGDGEGLVPRGLAQVQKSADFAVELGCVEGEWIESCAIPQEILWGGWCAEGRTTEAEAAAHAGHEQASRTERNTQ